MEWQPEDGADDWKTTPPDKNKLDFRSKIIVNSYSDVPFLYDNWKIRKEEAKRVDIFHRGTHFSLVLGESPYIEIYATNQYGDLTDLNKVVELGEYLE